MSTIVEAQKRLELAQAQLEIERINFQIRRVQSLTYRAQVAYKTTIASLGGRTLLIIILGMMGVDGLTATYYIVGTPEGYIPLIPPAVANVAFAWLWVYRGIKWKSISGPGNTRAEFDTDEEPPAGIKQRPRRRHQDDTWGGISLDELSDNESEASVRQSAASRRESK